MLIAAKAIPKPLDADTFHYAEGKDYKIAINIPDVEFSFRFINILIFDILIQSTYEQIVNICCDGYLFLLISFLHILKL